MSAITRERLSFLSDGFRLEGALAYPDHAVGDALVVLANPHPCLGGDMENNVILALEEEALHQGLAALRFNCRGVGGSQGEQSLEERIAAFWENPAIDPASETALRDLHAVVEAGVRAMGQPLRLFLIGYSFGGVIALLEASRRADVAGLAMISPPIHQLLGEPPTATPEVAVIVRAGDDLGVDRESHERLIANLPSPTVPLAYEETDHFYRGLESRLAADVWRHLLRR